MASDRYWLAQALELAKQAEAVGEVPVGAVIVKNDECIASAFNQPISLSDPTAHAEINALRKAGQHLNNYRLKDCELFVTLEPCPMCAAAIVHARIKRVVFSATDPKAGAACSVFHLLQCPQLNHQVAWEQGDYADEVKTMMQSFFKRRR